MRLAIVFILAMASTAAAQTRGPNYEVAFGGVVMGTMPLGEGDASLTRPDGRPFPIFKSDISLGPGPGAEVHAGRRLGSRLTIEATGTWTFAKVRAEVSSDIEGAPGATLTEEMSRVSVEGSALWRVSGGARRGFFVRAGAGWMRELAGGTTLTENGVIGNVGAGVKYWWGASSPSPRRRLGLRLEGRAVVRSGGIDLGEDGLRVAPAASLNLMFGF